MLQAYFGRAKVACLCSHCCSRHLWFYERERLEETSFAFIWIQYGGFNIAQSLTFIQKHSIARRKRLQYRLTSRFVQSLEFLKKSWKMLSNFPGLEKVWKIEMVKSLEFFFTATTSRLYVFNFFWFWSNLIRFHSYVCSAPRKKVLFLRCVDHLFDNLESGKRNYCFGKSLEKVLNFGSQNLYEPCNIIKAQS